MVFCLGCWSEVGNLVCFELTSKYPSMFKLFKGVIIKLFLYFRVLFCLGLFVFLAPFISAFCFESDGVGDTRSIVMLLVTGS